MRTLRGVMAAVPLLFLVVFPGCGTPRGPYSPMVREDGLRPHQLGEGVTMLDENVRDTFLLIGHSARRAPQGQMQVRVTMQNVFPDDDVWADVRFVFFNAGDEPVEASEWRTVLFPPRNLTLVEGNSIRSDVEKFNAQFRNLKSRSGKRLTHPGKVYRHGLWRESALPR